MAALALCITAALAGVTFNRLLHRFGPIPPQADVRRGGA